MSPATAAGVTGRVSVMYGAQVDGLGPLRRFAAFCEPRDLRLWLGQSFTIDSHDALSALGAAGHRVDTGIAVAVAPLRSPFDAAVRARATAALTGRPTSVAYGIGTATAAEALLGRPLERPGSYVRDYVRQVRRLLDGDPGLPMPLYPLRAPSVEVGCGVLRPRMARLAGQVADFAVTWLVPRPHLSGVIAPALVRGAEEAGRRPPRLVSVLQCAVARPDRVGPRLAATAIGSHLRLPHYRAMLSDAGVRLPGGPPVRDFRAALEAGAFSFGTPAQIAEVVEDHLAGGVDEVVLNLGAVALAHGVDAALEDLGDILAACPAPVQAYRPRHASDSSHREAV